MHEEFKIPEDIITYLSKDFLITFKEELHEIYKHSFYKDDIGYITSTAGWIAALHRTCIKYDCMEFYRYYNSLDWYYSDSFDGQIARMMIEQHILDD